MLRAAARLRIHLPPWGTRTTRCFVPGAAASSDWSPHITVLVPGAASSASSASSAVVPQYSSDMLPRPPSSTCAVPQTHLHCLGRPPAQSPHALAHSLRSPRSPTTPVTSSLMGPKGRPPTTSSAPSPRRSRWTPPWAAGPRGRAASGTSPGPLRPPTLMLLARPVGRAGNERRKTLSPSWRARRSWSGSSAR